MRQGCKGRFKPGFFRKQDGATTVEFAFAMPILIAFMIGIVEIANLLFLGVALENAVLHASRYGITGSEVDGVARVDRVRKIVEEQTFGRISPDALRIETLVFEQFSDIGREEPFADENGNGAYDAGEGFTDVNGNGVWDADVGTVGLGGAGDIVLYRVTHVAPSITGFMDWATQAVTLQSAVAVRNEPY